MQNIFKTIALVFAAFALLQAAPSDSLLSQAQKLYSQGNFEEAAKVFGSICPQLDAKDKKACLLKEVKALTESKKAEVLASAEEKLLAILSQTEPNDPMFAELSAEDAKLQLMLGQAARAVRSWRSAQNTANVNYFSELYVLCQDIVAAFPESGLTKENCDKVKPADTSLVSLPRNKVVPLSLNQNLQNSQNAQGSAGKWFVQLGAFGSKENAEKLVAAFKPRDVLLYITEVQSGDKTLYAVRTGTFQNKQDAETYAAQKIAPHHKDYKVLN